MEYFAQHKASPRAKPIYLSLVARATLSRHNGVPILEAYNPIYCYWATHRDLRRDEVTKYMPGYEGNMKQVKHAA